jgi:hypothetical protein
MNERINELSEQCRIETYGINGELLEFGFDQEKFAELIIKECAELFPERHYYYSGLAVKRNIKEHFGVEE